MKFTIAGGGAAGISAAISCKEKNSSTDVTVLEQGDKPLVKCLFPAEDAISQIQSQTLYSSHILPRGSRGLSVHSTASILPILSTGFSHMVSLLKRTRWTGISEIG